MSVAKPKHGAVTGCPICQRPPVESYRPFCSKRCADIDLGHWFNETYRIPARAEPDDEFEDAPPPDPNTAGSED